MATGKNKFMDVLGLSDDSGSSSSEGEEQAPQPTKKAKQEIDVQKLQEHGYSGGLSVLLVPDKAEEGEANWAWGSGAERRGESAEQEDFEQREANRAAVSSKAEESAAFSRMAQEQAQRLREEQRRERDELRKKKGLTWKDKEKRKRDEGKQSRGKSYVEEEKRRAREFGVVSGFD